MTKKFSHQTLVSFQVWAAYHSPLESYIRSRYENIPGFSQSLLCHKFSWQCFYYTLLCLQDRYSGDFSTICSVLWCSIPTNPVYCSTAIAAEGTLCGDKQVSWIHSTQCRLFTAYHIWFLILRFSQLIHGIVIRRRNQEWKIQRNRQ